MAYDKVVDSGALDAVFGGIADAIRGKTGTAGKLTIDQMAAAISGIVAGGGGAQSANGVYTLAAEASSMSIDITDIGFIPDVAVVYLDETNLEYTATPTKVWYMCYTPELLGSIGLGDQEFKSYTRTNIAVLWRGGKGLYVQQTAPLSTNYVGTSISDEGIKMYCSRSASAYPIIAGTYKWFVYKFLEDAE